MCIRDRKITVIDGQIGYTGGANIADEYANLIVRFGHWKDTAIRLEGEAVFSLTVTFLELWEAETGERQDYDAYRPSTQAESDGFFQPFSDGPANNPRNPAETMYRQMIANADRYVYFSTPYFVVPHDMMETICASAESGVDVKIIVPKMWDRWYVGIVSRSNYQRILSLIHISSCHIFQSVGVNSSSIAYWEKASAVTKIRLKPLPLPVILFVSVSYTHLDVYKRQGITIPGHITNAISRIRISVISTAVSGMASTSHRPGLNRTSK